jgi:hypothetical protein
LFILLYYSLTTGNWLDVQQQTTKEEENFPERGIFLLGRIFPLSFNLASTCEL